MHSVRYYINTISIIMFFPTCYNCRIQLLANIFRHSHHCIFHIYHQKLLPYIVSTRELLQSYMALFASYQDVLNGYIWYVQSHYEDKFTTIFDGFTSKTHNQELWAEKKRPRGTKINEHSSINTNRFCDKQQQQKTTHRHRIRRSTADNQTWKSIKLNLMQAISLCREPLRKQEREFNSNILY